MHIFQGRTVQFRTRLEEYWQDLYRVAYSWCHDPQLASKLAQEASLKAMRHAMENARLKEGKEVQLIPEANKVGAALEQIIKRLKLGWAYIRA